LKLSRQPSRKWVNPDTFEERLKKRDLRSWKGFSKRSLRRVFRDRGGFISCVAWEIHMPAGDVEGLRDGLSTTKFVNEWKGQRLASE